MSHEFPRGLAVQLLTQVLSDHKDLDEVLSQVDSHPARAWLQEICSGVLRWKGILDASLDAFAKTKKPSGWLRKVLLIAAYQIRVQAKTHPGLVVSETVDLIREREGQAPARFANACLRSLTSQPQETYQLLSLPPWLKERWIRDYGEKVTLSIAEAFLERPSIWVRVKDQNWVPEWGEKTELPLCFKKKPETGKLTDLDGFQEGKFLVQDISNQKLVDEVSHFLNPEDQILDLCAAPGGKSIALAWSGYSVTATDFKSKRFPILKASLSKLSPETKAVPWEERANLPLFDAVWVDPPCTGSGVLRRHPEIRWIKGEKGLASLKAIQKETIQLGLSHLKKGGLFIYSVCSLLKEEGSMQVDAPNLEKLKEWTLFPHESPLGDGFYCAIYRKNG